MLSVRWLFTILKKGGGRILKEELESPYNTWTKSEEWCVMKKEEGHTNKVPWNKWPYLPPGDPWSEWKCWRSRDVLYRKVSPAPALPSLSSRERRPGPGLTTSEGICGEKSQFAWLGHWYPHLIFWIPSWDHLYTVLLWKSSGFNTEYCLSYSKGRNY